MIEYKGTKLIDDSDLRPLYESVGWTSYTEKISDLSTLLTPCQLVFSAWDDGQFSRFNPHSWRWDFDSVCARFISVA